MGRKSENKATGKQKERSVLWEDGDVAYKAEKLKATYNSENIWGGK